MKRNFFLPNDTNLYFNQKTIRLQHGPVKTRNAFLLILFQHCVSKSADGKVKVQTNGMIAIRQVDSTVTVYPLKIRGFIQDLRLAKARATQLKPENIRIDELS